MPLKRLELIVSSLALVCATGDVHAQDISDTDVTATIEAPDQFELPAQMDHSQAVKITANYSADLNADVAGGARRGAAYLGRLGILFDAKPGWNDTLVHASVITIHGVGLSANFVGNLNPVSGLEAEPATRLNQLWVETALSDKSRIRIGKFPAAPNFATSNVASFFVNAAFGWPTSFALDLPQGGPAWPLATPGAMITTTASTHVSLSGAVFAGLPAGQLSDDPQRNDGHGFNAFQIRGAPLAIGETAVKIGKATVKAGGWYQFGQSAVLADALQTEGGNWSAYALVDFQLLPALANGRQINAFARLFLAPSDRNASPFYADAGLVIKAPLLRRPDDELGLAVGYVSVGGAAPFPTGDEFVTELSYQIPLSPDFSLQPNLQWVSQRRANPDTVDADKSAIVVGVRFNYQI